MSVSINDLNNAHKEINYLMGLLVTLSHSEACRGKIISQKDVQETKAKLDDAFRRLREKVEEEE